MPIQSATSASTIQTDYMKLLVTQLQNQDPLEPMSNQDMSAQLAQFSQLEQLENLNQSFGQVLENSEQGLANDLIGKEVSFIDMDSFNTDGTPGVPTTGQVTKMVMDGGNNILTVTEIDPATLVTTSHEINANQVTATQFDQFDQFTHLQQMNRLDSLNQSFDQILRSTNRNFANAMVGKNVSFLDMEATNSEGNAGVAKVGQVIGMTVEDNKEMLRIYQTDSETNEVSEYLIDADKVTSILDPFGA
jgi:flagellar basal-body rod modification protein FlgD